MSSVASYVPALDGLRAVAVIAVMVYHSGLILGGYLGVDVFFTLSGFLITRLLVEEYDARGTIGLRDFYYRRALRLLPALFTFLTVCTIVLLSTVPLPFWYVIWTYLAIVTFYVANWALILGSPLGILGHTWSLAIEEQFYLALPFLIRTVRPQTLREVLVWLLVAAPVVRGHSTWTCWRIAGETEGILTQVNDELKKHPDAVIILLPLTTQTRGLVDARFLSAMRPGALLVNPARGAIVDTEALTGAVLAGRLRAALDVTDPEPLPDGHPLWSAPGVLITPHVAGSVRKLLDRAWRLIADQVRRYQTGAPLRNVVVDGY